MKHIVFEDGNSENAVEEEAPSGRIKVWFFCWKILTDKRFRYDVEYTIKYALRHWRCYRGTGSSDVLLFKENDSFLKMWKEV